MISFDDLSKALARGLSRREALRWIGGGIGGSLLGMAASTSRVSAAPNNCAVACNQPSLGGPAKASCIQACHACESGGNLCVSPTGSTCCPSDKACCGGGGFFGGGTGAPICCEP